MFQASAQTRPSTNMADEEDIDIDGDDFSDDGTPISTTELSVGPADGSRSRTASQRGTPAPSDAYEDHLDDVDDAYSIPEWLSQTEQSIDTTGMDDQSRALIEQMLAEEDYYFGGRSASFGGFEVVQGHASSRAGAATGKRAGGREKDSASKRRRGADEEDAGSSKSGGGGAKARRRLQNEAAAEKTKLSSADLPSHNTRWTPEEDERLRDGLVRTGAAHISWTNFSAFTGMSYRIALPISLSTYSLSFILQKRHGYGNWKVIAGVVGTRNPLQCKNHARHLLVSDKIDDDVAPDFTSAPAPAPAPLSPNNLRRSSSHDSGDESKRRKTTPGGTPSSSASSSRLKRKHGTSESGGEDDAYGRAGTPGSTEYVVEEMMAEGVGGTVDRVGVVGEAGEAGEAAKLALETSSADPSAPKPFPAAAADADTDDSDISIDIDVDSDDDRSSPASASISASLAPGRWSRTVGADRVYEMLVNNASPSPESEPEQLRTGLAASGSRSPSPFAGSGRVKKRGGREEEERAEEVEGFVKVEIVGGAVGDTPPKRGRTVSFGGVRTKFIDDEEEVGRGRETEAVLKTEMEMEMLTEAEEGRGKSDGDVCANVQGQTIREEVTTTSPAPASFVTGEGDKGDMRGVVDSMGVVRVVDEDAIGGGRANVEETVVREGGHSGRFHGGAREVIGEAKDNVDAKGRVGGDEAEEDEDADESEDGGLGTRRSAQEKAPLTPAFVVRMPSFSRPHFKILDQTTVTAEERRDNSEWFVGKHPKTPERYAKIRNYILGAWARCRPRYLTKTSIRPGLKDCGDVNAIGRVHTYLERVGAINVGCITTPPKPKRPAVRRKADERSEEEDEEADVEMPAWIAEYDGPRRRRVRNEYGEWVDPKELEGRVISHENGAAQGDDDELGGMTKEELQELYEQERLAAQNARHFAPGEIPVNTKIPKHKRAQFYLKRQQAISSSQGANHHRHHGGADGAYDPFLLIPMKHYTAREPAPFRVAVLSDVVLVMDFHSHLAHTEIIGLLGGTYDPDRCVLYVVAAFPCRSLSTGIQCEMDPASEMQAREVFAERGLVVVGWYHSHPTFEPNPSVRDIENQSAYQALFRRDTGVEPFIGVIVSPYDPRHPSNQSRVQYLSISARWNEDGGYRVCQFSLFIFYCRIFVTSIHFFQRLIQCSLSLTATGTPYACDRDITRSDRIPPELFVQLSELVRDYRGYEQYVHSPFLLNLLLRRMRIVNSLLRLLNSRVDLTEPYRRGETLTRLDKLLDSISANLYVPEDAAAVFLAKVRELLEVGFRSVGASTATATAVVTGNLTRQEERGKVGGAAVGHRDGSGDGVGRGSTEEGKEDDGFVRLTNYRCQSENCEENSRPEKGKYVYIRTITILYAIHIDFIFIPLNLASTVGSPRITTSNSIRKSLVLGKSAPRHGSRISSTRSDGEELRLPRDLGIELDSIVAQRTPRFPLRP
ncbi:LOW QUALITY PROTEIN: hypothetical protein BC938DRAFT_482788 [Jimgerdemannia flammicorona]|uniref:Uncharacterized protein n=1 Tax=Jimgerdemannia flammicorona TaxID=994334 RepID=A0A433QW33_9FUNG|nr:LOW QUALITY PROTEIN: hypothetical protein BC938DRAFT_482788 [Jimgerdemannia flammicorona]